MQSNNKETTTPNIHALNITVADSSWLNEGKFFFFFLMDGLAEHGMAEINPEFVMLPPLV